MPRSFLAATVLGVGFAVERLQRTRPGIWRAILRTLGILAALALAVVAVPLTHHLLGWDRVPWAHGCDP